MVKLTISFNCGCGFKTPDILVAIQHAQDKGHSLDANGMIIGDKEKEK